MHIDFANCTGKEQWHSVTFHLAKEGIKSIQIGGLNKTELQEELQRKAILLNESAKQLFASEHFTTSLTRYTLQTVEITAQDLGFVQGATMTEIVKQAETLGLALCPIELAPHLRLQYLDQPEGYWGQPERVHQAPSGSITIVSAPLSDDHTIPKGFYVRRIQGELWLRGYRSGPEHIWQPDDHFLFVQA